MTKFVDLDAVLAIVPRNTSMFADICALSTTQTLSENCEEIRVEPTPAQLDGPDVIWLEPSPGDCDGRRWGEEPHESDTTDSTMYIRADLIRALPAQPAQAGSEAVPVAWRYEYAMAYAKSTDEYHNWSDVLVSIEKPNGPDRAIRNLTPLYAALPDPVVVVEKLRAEIAVYRRLYGELEPIKVCGQGNSMSAYDNGYGDFACFAGRVGDCTLCPERADLKKLAALTAASLAAGTRADGLRKEQL